MRLAIWVPAVVVMPEVKVIGLPPIVYVPPEKVNELKVVNKGKLLLALRTAALAGNTRSSPATAAISSSQFAAVPHEVLAPPPSQVLVAAAAKVAPHKIIRLANIAVKKPRNRGLTKEIDFGMVVSSDRYLKFQ